MGAVATGIVVVFVIILICSFVYKTVVERNKSYTWPPHITKCPEYWKLNGEKCTLDTINRGSNVENAEMDAYDGSDLTKFAKDLSLNGTHWDGISNM